MGMNSFFSTISIALRETTDRQRGEPKYKRLNSTPEMTHDCITIAKGGIFLIDAHRTAGGEDLN